MTMNKRQISSTYGCSTTAAILLCFALRLLNTNNLMTRDQDLGSKFDADHWTAPLDDSLFSNPGSDSCPVSLFHVSLHQISNFKFNQRKGLDIYKLNRTTRLSLLLMIAGDVNPNPGPRKIKYPCQICNKAAKWGQKCIECENCEGWFHKSCLGMSNEIYEVLANHPSCSWVCDSCGLA